MKTSLEKARGILESGTVTCALVRGDTVHTSTERGVKPLLAWINEGTDLKNFSAADKVVGKATAHLYCLLGVKEVYAAVISTAAVKILVDLGEAPAVEVDGVVAVAPRGRLEDAGHPDVLNLG